MLEKSSIHQAIKQWNHYVDWFATTSVFLFLGMCLGLAQTSVERLGEVFAMFAAFTVIYLGFKCIYNARNRSHLFNVIVGGLSAVTIVGAGDYFSDPVITIMRAIVVVMIMVFFYKMSRRQCRQAWCVDFTDQTYDNLCKVCMERRNLGENIGCSLERDARRKLL